MKKHLILIGMALMIILLQIVTISASAYDYYPYSYPYSFMLVWLSIWFIIWILVSLWVKKDAGERGKNGIKWFSIVFLVGFIGLIIWLIIRPPIGGEKKEPDRRCPNCGRIIPFDAKICPYCGKKFEDNFPTELEQMKKDIEG